MSSGQFWWGMTTGLVAGAVVGMSVAPSRREMKKTAHKVAKHVNEAVEDLTETLPSRQLPPRADRGGSCLDAVVSAQAHSRTGTGRPGSSSSGVTRHSMASTSTPASAAWRRAAPKAGWVRSLGSNHETFSI